MLGTEEVYKTGIFNNGSRSSIFICISESLFFHVSVGEKEPYNLVVLKNRRLSCMYQCPRLSTKSTDHFPTGVAFPNFGHPVQSSDIYLSSQIPIFFHGINNLAKNCE